MEKPNRCIDPVIKYCQECKYGIVIYPGWVESYEDTLGCVFKTKCMYDLEKTEPTNEEVEEFERWIDRMYKFDKTN